MTPTYSDGFQETTDGHEQSEKEAPDTVKETRRGAKPRERDVWRRKWLLWRNPRFEGTHGVKDGRLGIEQDVIPQSSSTQQLSTCRSFKICRCAS